jgi:hypothetical protein
MIKPRVLPLLSLSASLALCGCRMTTEAPQPSAVSQSAQRLMDDVLSLRAVLRSERVTVADPARTLAIETVMTVLSTSVNALTVDLRNDSASADARLGMLVAIRAEIDAARSDSLVNRLGTDLAAQARAGFARVLSDVSAAEALIPGPTPPETPLSAAWMTALRGELAYADSMAGAGTQLLTAVQTCAAARPGVRALSGSLAQTFQLHGAFRIQTATAVQRGAHRYDDWARRKATGRRMEGLSQLIATWLRTEPSLLDCSLPPVPLDTYVQGDDKKDCIKVSNGDEAGAIGGNVSATVTPTKKRCSAGMGEVKFIPIPTP